MNVKLTPHAAKLLEAMRAQSHEPAEVIVEQALEVFAHEHRKDNQESEPDESQRQAVRDMLDFVKQNRVRLGPGASVKDLIHEGHRV